MEKFTKFSMTIAAFFIIIASANAQEPPPSPIFEGFHKNVYANLGGPNVEIGANFDMRLTRGKMDGIGFRVGIGGIEGYGNSHDIGVVTIPLEFNYISGRRRHGFVAGVGLLPTFVTVTDVDDWYERRYAYTEGFGLLGAFINMGYRFQPKKNGIFGQISWTPLILRTSGFMPLWGSIGIGYGFK